MISYTLFVGFALCLQVLAIRHAQLSDEFALDITNSSDSKALNNATSGKNEATRATVKVKVLFIRHGHACHNAMAKQSANGGVAFHCGVPDPPLTDCGQRKSINAGVELRKMFPTVDFVGSSSMLRAMETAHAMYPDEKIHPLPFIKEVARVAIPIGQLGSARCNKPNDLTPAIQEELQGQFGGADKLDFKYVVDKFELTDSRLGYFKKKWSASGARKALYWKGFRAFLGEKVLPDLVSANSNKTTLTLAIVSHSNALTTRIGKYFDCKKPKIKFSNNGAKMFEYSYDVEAKIVTEVKGDCDTPPFVADEWTEKYLCPKDYNRCMTYRGGYMHLVDDKLTGGKKSGWIKNQRDDSKSCCLDE